MVRQAEVLNKAAVACKQVHNGEESRAALRSQRRQLFQAFMLSAACLGGIGLTSPRMARGQLIENWDSLNTNGGLLPSSAPAAGTPYTITTSGPDGMGAWTAICSDPTNAYYAAGPAGDFGAGGSGNIVGEGGASHDNSQGSNILQSPAFYLSDAATGGSISLTYIGGAYGGNVPPNISGLGTQPGNGGVGFMGVALVDPNGNVVASSSAYTAPGNGTGTNITLSYSGLSTTTPYTFDLIDDGTRGGNWGWNGVDNINIPSGSFTAPSLNDFNWVAGAGDFNTGSNWDQGTAPSNVTTDNAMISNGGTATIGSSDTVTCDNLYVGSNTGTNTGNVVQTGGSVTLGGALAVGYSGGLGSYNLSGSSTFTANSLVVGSGSGSSGLFIQTGGTVIVSSIFAIGSATGVGTFNISGGTINFNGGSALVVVGYGSTPSVLNVSGSAVINSSNGNISIGDAPSDGSSATGILNLSGAASINAGQQFFVGNGAGNTGIANISGGSITSDSWISIGRTGATGIVNLGGTGSITKVAGSSGGVSLGGSNDGVGILNQTGGTFTDASNSGNFEELGENAGSTGVWNMSGGTATINIIQDGFVGTGIVNLSGTAQFTTNQFLVSYNTGSTGTLNLNGGTLTTTMLQQDSGTAIVNLNGGTVQASANNALLLNNFTAGSVNALAGGAIFDTNGYTATLTSSITSPTGVTGGFTKIGSGVLILAAANTYSGSTTVSAGTLRLIAPTTPVAIANYDFVANNANGYTYYNGEPATDGYWNYFSDGGNTAGAGITNGGGFGFNGTPPSGSQAAFIQRAGSIQQSVSFPQAGSYALGFYTEQRNGGNASFQALQVLVDGTDISSGGFVPLTTWTQTTYVFPETAGSHTIDFQGTNPNGGDNTALLDDVTLAGSFGTGPGTYIPATSAVVIAANATLDLNGNIEPIGSLTGAALSSVTLGTGQLITGGDGTSTSFAGVISGTGGSVSKIGSGVQTLSGANTYTGGTNVSGGSLVFAAPGALPNFTSLTIGAGASAVAASHNSSSPKNTLFVTGLSIAGGTGAWTGTLDLGNNDMVVRNGSLATITNQVAQGYNNGGWNGSGGIISSAAAANTTHLTALGVIQDSVNGTPTGSALYASFDGQTVGDTDVLVKYTYYGDANLDGKVDASDYSLIDNGYLNHLTGWYNGDFNYDGVVNGSDYTLIDNVFNMQGAQLSAEVATTTDQISPTSVVPEPATLSVVAIGMASLLRRRRRFR